jgi:hypothetical protein
MIVVLLGAGLFALLGSLLAVVGLVFLGRGAGFNRRAVRVDGRVVGHREHFSTSRAIHRRIYFPTVRYGPPGGPELEASAPGEDAPLELGTSLSMLVDPQHPEQVSFTGPRGSAGVAWALVVVGLGTVLLSLLGIVGMVVLFSI